MEFDWDEHNLYHIAMHGISRDEVETALTGRTVFIKNEVRNGEDSRTVVGITGGKRILVVVSTPRAGKSRCVTAFPANRFFSALHRAKWPGEE